jgi:hypothetical protein
MKTWRCFMAGDRFETTYVAYDRLGNLRQMTCPSGLPAEFADRGTAKRSGGTAWGFNPR